MKKVLKAILITLSFVLTVGIISSAAMMLFDNPNDHISFISGGAQLIYLIAAVVILKLRKVKISEKCGLVGAPFISFLLPVGAGFCFSVFSSTLQEILTIPKFLMGETANTVGNSVAAFIAAIYVIAPITEEFVFRGMIMTGLRRALNSVPSVLVSAVLFGAIHLMTGSIITAVHAMLGGLIFGLAYEKTGSLFSAIAAHLAGNLGGLIPDMLNGTDFTVQLIIAIAAGIVSALLCVILMRKNSALCDRIRRPEE